MKLENYPVVKLLFPYAIGVVIAYYADFGSRMRPVMLILTGVFFLMVFSLTFVKAYRWRVLKTMVMNIAFVLTGILLTDLQLHPDYSPDYMENNTEWIVRVEEEPSLRKKSVKVPAIVMNSADNKKVKATISRCYGITLRKSFVRTHKAVKDFSALQSRFFRQPTVYAAARHILFGICE